MQVAFCFLAIRSQAQTMTLKVTSFGAQGDAVSVAANTVKGSPVITVQTTDALTNADVGKLMLLFGVGPSTTPTTSAPIPTD